MKATTHSTCGRTDIDICCICKTQCVPNYICRISSRNELCSFSATHEVPILRIFRHRYIVWALPTRRNILACTQCADTGTHINNTKVYIAPLPSIEPYIYHHSINWCHDKVSFSWMQAIIRTNVWRRLGLWYLIIIFKQADEISFN